MDSPADCFFRKEDEGFDLINVLPPSRPAASRCPPDTFLVRGRIHWQQSAGGMPVNCCQFYLRMWGIRTHLLPPVQKRVVSLIFTHKSGRIHVHPEASKRVWTDVHTKLHPFYLDLTIHALKPHLMVWLFFFVGLHPAICRLRYRIFCSAGFSQFPR